MPKVDLYNQQGEKIRQVELPADIFEVSINPDVMNLAVLAQRAAAKKTVAHVKDRSEVSGGGRKPWRQKGSGRARHGSIRSPIWRGGGVTFGPSKERNFFKKINKKAKQKALLMGLSSKARDKEIILMDKIDIAEPKTKLMTDILKKLPVGEKGKNQPGILIVQPATDMNLIKASRNIYKIRIIRADSLNIVDILSHKYLLLLSDSIEVMKKVFNLIKTRTIKTKSVKKAKKHE